MDSQHDSYYTPITNFFPKRTFPDLVYFGVGLGVWWIDSILGGRDALRSLTSAHALFLLIRASRKRYIICNFLNSKSKLKSHY